MNNLFIIVIIIVIFVALMFNRTENLYGDIVGNPQKWIREQRDDRFCQTDYNDDDCKFVALNCIGNESSLLRDA